MFKKLLILLILLAIGYAAFYHFNRTLIDSTLQMDLRDTAYIQHSLLDEKAKRDLLLLYTDTNDQLYRLARTSKLYWTYDAAKNHVLVEQEKKSAAIMKAYRKRKNASR